MQLDDKSKRSRDKSPSNPKIFVIYGEWSRTRIVQSSRYLQGEVFGRALPSGCFTYPTTLLGSSGKVRQGKVRLILVRSKLSINTPYLPSTPFSDWRRNQAFQRKHHQQTSVGLGRRFYCSRTWLPFSVNVLRLVQFWRCSIHIIPERGRGDEGTKIFIIWTEVSLRCISRTSRWCPRAPFKQTVRLLYTNSNTASCPMRSRKRHSFLHSHDLITLNHSFF